MSYVMGDLRVKVILATKSWNRNRQLAYLGGLLWGLRVAERWLGTSGVTTYHSETGDFLQSRSQLPLAQVVQEWNDKNQKNLALNVADNTGDLWRQQKEADSYFDGFQIGMQYVPGLYEALREDNLSKGTVVAEVLDLVRLVRNWVDERRTEVNEMVQKS